MARRPTDTDEFPGIPPGVQLEPVPRATLGDGRPNREHYRAQMTNLNAIQQYYLAATGAGVANYNQTLLGIKEQAKLAGIDLKDVLDGRTEDQKLRDAIGKLLGEGGHTALELAEGELEAILKAERASVEMIDELIAQESAKADEEGIKRRLAMAELEARRARGKRWWRLIREMIGLRQRTRQQRPKKNNLPDSTLDAWEASYPWRLAAYTYRSDLSSAYANPSEAVMRLARHHATMAFRLWEARNGVKFYAEGNEEECRKYPSIFHPIGGAVRDAYHCEMLVLVCPPRHGKSTFGTGWMLSEFTLDPRLQAFLLHAMQPHAAKNFRHIKEAIEGKSAVGRRFRALFPEIKLSPRDNTKETMRLALGEPTRDPQLTAVGGKTGVGGSNTNIQWWDDPVDPKEREQPNERESTKRRLMQQVRQRMQGKRPFLLVTATLWHIDDAVNCLIDDARTGRISAAVCIMPCGGPPDFKPLWPEEMGVAALRRKWNEMRNPTDFRAQYCCDPRPEESRIIKRLRLYDSEAVEHAAFVKTAEMHLSLDPSATSRDRIRKRHDHSALVYAGVGDLAWSKEENGSIQTTTRRVLRIVEASRFYAGPTEAIEAVAEFSLTHRVDRVHIEEVGFSTAIIESLRANFSLSSSQIIGHKPRAVSKKDRLKAVSPMLDDSLVDKGLGAAVVEFPGVKQEDGSLMPVDGIKWLVDEIMDFGSAKSDDGVDAVTQLCKGCAGLVDVSSGEITSAVQVAMVHYSASDIQRRLVERLYARAGATAPGEVTSAEAARQESEFFDRTEGGGFSQEMEDVLWATGLSG